MRKKELHATKNVDINIQRQAEHLRQLYLDEKHESKDLALNNQECFQVFSRSVRASNFEE